jgi:glutathione S-transferase
MYELYIANKNYSSWSLRPWVLLRELQIPFAEHLEPFEPDNWDRFRKFSPTGKVPCLVTPRLTIWDSLAITEYLAEKHAGVWPGDEIARAWSRAVTAEMHSGFAALRQECPMNCGVRVQMFRMSAALQKDIDRLNELWQEGLGRFGGPFLAGASFTAVDAFFCPVAFRVQTYKLQLAGAPAAYAERLLALPAMKDWNRAALAETWRDESHEQESLLIGKIEQDLRAPGRTP